MLNKFFPLKFVTVTNHEPAYVTPEIKSLLRKKNKLMHRHKTDAAGSIAKRIGDLIRIKNASEFSDKNPITDTKDLWSRVRRITGKEKKTPTTSTSITAEKLNEHYCKISTDPQYVKPTLKDTVTQPRTWITEESVFKLLDTLKVTAPGLDEIPFWFLQLSAPLLAKPLASLYNLSLLSSEIPKQWKVSCITPVPKITHPVACSEYRPISVTPILSRILEKIVVRQFLYPVLYDASSKLFFEDQYAFRPTGSTTSALINLTHQISKLLEEFPYVHLIALDFSKAFDTVRHSTLLSKCADLPIHDFVHNWLLKFLENRQHCTKFDDLISLMLFINASIVQGSVIGPFAYVINASDLRALYALDKLNKYADDSYLIVPSINSQLVREELDHISTWASNNNLMLNVDKSKEMIIKCPRTRSAAPPPLLGIERVESMNILGVIFQCNLSFTMQVDRLVVRGAQTMYALGTLKHHGLGGPPLWEVTRATFIARLTYASQAWWGLLDAQGRARLEKVLNKAVRGGFLPKSHPSFAQICDSADEQMFGDILKNPKHVLHHLLPPVSEAKSRLRTRAHDREMPAANQNTFTRKTFISRMLMLNSY